MKFGVNRPEIDLQKAKHVEHSGEPGHISTGKVQQPVWPCFGPSVINGDVVTFDPA
jgi:hypothetical protein